MAELDELYGVSRRVSCYAAMIWSRSNSARGRVSGALCSKVRILIKSRASDSIGETCTVPVFLLHFSPLLHNYTAKERREDLLFPYVPRFSDVVALKMKLEWLCKLQSALCELGAKILSLHEFVEGILRLSVQASRSAFVGDGYVRKRAAFSVRVDMILDHFISQLEFSFGRGFESFLHFVVSCDPKTAVLGTNGVPSTSETLDLTEFGRMCDQLYIAHVSSIASEYMLSETPATLKKFAMQVPQIFVTLKDQEKEFAEKNKSSKSKVDSVKALGSSDLSFFAFLARHGVKMDGFAKWKSVSADVSRDKYEFEAQLNLAYLVVFLEINSQNVENLQSILAPKNVDSKKGNEIKASSNKNSPVTSGAPVSPGLGAAVDPLSSSSSHSPTRQSYTAALFDVAKTVGQHHYTFSSEIRERLGRVVIDHGVAIGLSQDQVFSLKTSSLVNLQGNIFDKSRLAVIEKRATDFLTRKLDTVDGAQYSKYLKPIASDTDGRVTSKYDTVKGWKQINAEREAAEKALSPKKTGLPAFKVGTSYKLE